MPLQQIALHPRASLKARRCYSRHPLGSRLPAALLQQRKLPHRAWYPAEEWDHKPPVAALLPPAAPRCDLRGLVEAPRGGAHFLRRWACPKRHAPAPRARAAARQRSAPGPRASWEVWCRGAGSHPPGARGIHPRGPRRGAARVPAGGSASGGGDLRTRERAPWCESTRVCARGELVRAWPWSALQAHHRRCHLQQDSWGQRMDRQQPRHRLARPHPACSARRSFPAGFPRREWLPGVTCLSCGRRSCIAPQSWCHRPPPCERGVPPP
mmetsp:Transcript_8172/g.19920  ORF Transcript_8172/g.19920 Transcript_8172/m.19920 type:complete len:268 (+) Transcript_8172:305-1108(+)